MPKEHGSACVQATGEIFGRKENIGKPSADPSERERWDKLRMAVGEMRKVTTSTNTMHLHTSRLLLESLSPSYNFKEDCLLQKCNRTNKGKKTEFMARKGPIHSHDCRNLMASLVFHVNTHCHSI